VNFFIDQPATNLASLTVIMLSCTVLEMQFAENYHAAKSVAFLQGGGLAGPRPPTLYHARYQDGSCLTKLVSLPRSCHVSVQIINTRPSWMQRMRLSLWVASATITWCDCYSKHHGYNSWWESLANAVSPRYLPSSRCYSNHSEGRVLLRVCRVYMLINPSHWSRRCGQYKIIE